MKNKLTLLLFFLVSEFALTKDEEPVKYINVQYNVVVLSSACGARGHYYFLSSHPSKSIRVNYKVNTSINGPGSSDTFEAIVPPKSSLQLGCTPTYGVTIINAVFVDN